MRWKMKKREKRKKRSVKKRFRFSTLFWGLTA